MATMSDLEDGGLMLRMVQQEERGAWDSNESTSHGLLSLVFFMREKSKRIFT